MSLRVIFMDAGQGDATLVVYPDNSLVLIDCGCKKNKDIVSGEIGALIDHFVAQAPGKKIKGLILTHPDGDHYNLVKPLIYDKKISVDKTYYGGLAKDYAGLKLASDGSDMPKSYSKFNVIDDLSYKSTKKGVLSVDFRVLAANVGNPKVKKDANPNSVVCCLTFGNYNFFLMGDATTLTENYIRLRMESKIKTLVKGRKTILKAGHHGSNTSSSSDWIKLIQPAICFISSDTKSFSGVSLPRSSVIDNIFTNGNIENYSKTFTHNYVQYSDNFDEHQNVSTTKAMFTTLHLLKFTNPPANTAFISYGTSWYYEVQNSGNEIGTYPACGWDNINKAY